MLGIHSDGVRTPITLHCGSIIFNVVVKAETLVRNCRVFHRSQRKTQALYVVLVSNLRPVFEKVKFAVGRILKTLKDLDGHFDPS